MLQGRPRLRPACRATATYAEPARPSHTWGIRTDPCPTRPASQSELRSAHLATGSYILHMSSIAWVRFVAADGSVDCFAFTAIDIAAWCALRAST